MTFHQILPKLFYTCVLSACFAITLSFAPQAYAASSVAVKFETTKGDIILRLDGSKAPETVANFLNYVKSGHYDGTVFHRVIPGFMIQGGGMTSDMKEKPTEKPIKNEAANGLDNDKYTIAMARTSNPHSATAQFFINVANNTFLNYSAPTAQGYGYTVFGKVIKGQDVVDMIVKVPTGRRGAHENVPLDPVMLTKASVVQ